MVSEKVIAVFELELVCFVEINVAEVGTTIEITNTRRIEYVKTLIFIAISFNNTSQSFLALNAIKHFLI